MPAEAHDGANGVPVLEGEVALVTGASRGIGRAIAQCLAANGATVIGTATSEEGASAIGDWLQASGHAGFGVALDIGSQDSVDAVVAAVAERAGSVSILVNNAGITRDNLLIRMKDEEWEQTLQTNLGGLYRMCRALIKPMMKARKGRIINIGSVVGLMGNAGQTNYAAAKAGMGGFTRSLAREVAARGITVNCVAPGFIETDMTRAMSESQQEALRAQIPVNRLGSPADIAAAVLYLASPGAGYVTGETLNVNGGMYMA